MDHSSKYKKMKEKLIKILYPHGKAPKNVTIQDLLNTTEETIKGLTSEIQKIGKEKFENVVREYSPKDGDMIVITVPPAFMSDQLFQAAQNIKESSDREISVVVLPDYLAFDTMTDEQLGKLNLKRI
jgi:hypothetical protein